MRVITLIFAVLLLASCSGQKDKIYSTKKGAIDGYDPVSYFLGAMPQQGMETISCMWNGAMWYFASEDNRTLFESMPEKYAPQYGGYCAYAVSQGYTAKIDPLAWKIVDEKLYLNYNDKIQVKWEADQDEYIMYGDANWPKVLED